VIGALGGADPKQLPTALMVLPAASALMVVIMIVLRAITPKKA
jgi:hypothetical protein